MPQGANEITMIESPVVLFLQMKVAQNNLNEINQLRATISAYTKKAPIRFIADDRRELYLFGSLGQIDGEVVTKVVKKSAGYNAEPIYVEDRQEIWPP